MFKDAPKGVEAANTVGMSNVLKTTIHAKSNSEIMITLFIYSGLYIFSWKTFPKAASKQTFLHDFYFASK